MRGLICIIAEELNTCPAGGFVEFLSLAAVCAHLLIQDPHFLTHLPQPKRLGDHRSTAVARTADRILAGSNASDKRDSFCLGFPNFEQVFEFQIGDHPRVIPIIEFGWLVGYRTSGCYDRPYFERGSIDEGRLEIAHHPANAFDACTQVDMDIAFHNLAGFCLQQRRSLDICRRDLIQLNKLATQAALLFHQVSLESLIRNSNCGCHPADPPADHQCFLDQG